MSDSATTEKRRSPGIDRRRAEILGKGFERIETHISWVFLGAEDVFKVKKPVDLGFLDFSTRELRRRACEAEVELNARLAPGVYLGVVPIFEDDDGGLSFGHAGDTGDEEEGPVDWAVHMRRLDERTRADRRLESGLLAAEDLERLAERLARFHDEARVDAETAEVGGIDAVTENVRENFDQTRAALPGLLGRESAEALEVWQLGFLERERDRFTARASSGRVRDGHGDLRLEHVYFEGPVDLGATAEGGDPAPLVVDCIEFNRRFRFADVAADVAFLAMDLVEHQRADLAERFLAAYAHASGDYGLYPLIDFYASYRAFVRGKVASMLASQAGVGEAVRERAEAEARRYFLLALSASRRPLREPLVVAVGGWIASGKSTVARALAERLDAPILDADGTRKDLLGVEPETPVHDPAFGGAYSPEFTEKVYAEVRRRAEQVLDSGRPVIVDASFRARAERAAVRDLAREHDVPFHFVECRAPEATCRERLRERELRPSTSDGRIEIFDSFLEHWETVDELPADEHLVLDTTRPLAEHASAFAERFPELPASLP